ncbi:hypothetical protein PC111_g14170 [Phytophthora cactorum]|uniref:Uncharacterized protein n=1 Tax=Phytophthora cactorum TaxID=29920 RepID=A0A8T1BJM0_9STRA|nr:hypothetical protein PC111_g14170 [Phytophthora cactorum]KAG2904634.1 hypothetical protein PC115_g14902 [Phytophthora cactorum]KAG3081401.1 hypothetical protein PC121_g6453 [Phytophthora cactorum]KAG3094713.1 hypothetical protein PC122_g5637 [Phytophthora cactorum]KAG3182523.1 hypothetical protein PC128_g14633 [Phytophthora cactorum]
MKRRNEVDEPDKLPGLPKKLRSILDAYLNGSRRGLKRPLRLDFGVVFVLSAVEVSVASNTTYQRNRMLGTRLSCANLAAVKLKLL